ncbi:MAG TPA: hypothetical protein PK339_09295 [Flavitalea sp.]|nr:hypothetical protein [Flavitalea sp.]
MNRSKFIRTLGKGVAIYTVAPLIPGISSPAAIRSGKNQSGFLKISGVYPHLSAFNKGPRDACRNSGQECGIGALAQWENRLWWITYGPSCPLGSTDKLYSIGDSMALTEHPESVGGTCANRMIHTESGQLIIGRYFIDRNKKVRVVAPEKMEGRFTNVMRHLSDAANKVYFFAMEGEVFEVDVHSLESVSLFRKPVPGWHGKGGYTAQGRLIISNNAEEGGTFEIDGKMLSVGRDPQNEEDAGLLAEWDGNNWSIIRRRQFTDITGPGDIHGAPDEKAPAWSIGWDKRSVILMLLDRGEWQEFRFPKATHTYDSVDGWYTEWPRIRFVSDQLGLMDMHGLLYEFPRSFSGNNISGIRPLCSHLTIINDFASWKNEIVIATNQNAVTHNPMTGQSQSNLWFGKLDDIRAWGPSNGWGAIWLNDSVSTGIASVPYFIFGFKNRVVHLVHDSLEKVTFTLDVFQGNTWRIYKNITVDKKSYRYHIFPDELEAVWVRVRSDSDCSATVYFHCHESGHEPGVYKELFNAIADLGERRIQGGLIRPGGDNRNLQHLSFSASGKGKNEYYELDQELQFQKADKTKVPALLETSSIVKDFQIDEASVIVEDRGKEYRLPRTDSRYDKPFSTGWPRGKREVITQRSMINVHGTFYEFGNSVESLGMATVRPICTHGKQIVDYCMWRGLFVIAGTKLKAKAATNYFHADKQAAGLWFGNMEDLWKFGKPVGYGGPWKNTRVKAHEPSLPFLMTGYDKKQVEIIAESDATITLEVDFDHTGWHVYQTFNITAGRPLVHEFPKGFSAHWVRAVSDTATTVSVQLLYS